MIHTNGKHLLFVAVTGIAMILASGCQSTAPNFTAPLAYMNPFRSAKPEIEYQQPVRMAVLWKESVVNAPGKKPTRGFGGRVYFYNEENETVRVDGNLTVYAFDDSNDEDMQARAPDRKYVFRASELQMHHGQTGLGESYNVWLPWDEVGGERKTIALVPIFKPVNGLIHKSDQSMATLSGTTSERETQFAEEAGATDPMVRQVTITVPPNERPNQASRVAISADEGVNESTETNRSVRTTTFELPRSTAARMNMSAYTPPQPRFVDNKSKSKSGSAATSNPGTSATAPPAAKGQVMQGSPIGSTQSGNADRRARVFGQPGSFR